MRSIKYNRVELFRISLNNSFSFKEFPKKTGYWIKKKSFNKLFDRKKLIINILQNNTTYYNYILQDSNIISRKLSSSNLSKAFHYNTRQGWETLFHTYSCLALVGNPTWSYPDREQVHARYFLPNP